MANKTIVQSLNKAYRRIGIPQEEVVRFKAELSNYFLQRSSQEATEEEVKQDIINFLNRTFYERKNRVSPHEHKDLVIHLGDTSSSPVGVIIEVKKPSNEGEMVTRDNLNKKAMQELLLYYLRDRITKNNYKLKNLVITNGFEFFVFDAEQFERIFYSNRALRSEYAQYISGQMTDSRTQSFYTNVASAYIAQAEASLDYTWFDIRTYKRALSSEDETQLADLYRFFSPEHLLKRPFQADSNSLNTKFYNELLYILGLEEVKAAKTGNKKIIKRFPVDKRKPASLIEDAISAIRAEGGLSNVRDVSVYGKDSEEQLYNVALSLVVGWVNRILFLKLLESQLQTYHPGDDSFSFLSPEKLPNYSAMNSLFFRVLAIRREDRDTVMSEKFGNVPYLNSSLFEVSPLEEQTIKISSLGTEILPLYASSVLKSQRRGGRNEEMSSLTYLLNFLSAYDFASESSDSRNNENKALINASVLGLIFEKINGHKDGAVFTPGFITMQICKESLREAVVDKLNERFNWDCSSFEDLFTKEFRDINAANEVVDSIRVCDPAVGSGHFLVSYLNEFIRTKYELGILCDTEGHLIPRTLYNVSIENDELIVTDNEGRPFRYRPNQRESQRIQETLFEQKRRIIENCLFGVDLNENAVGICRLRLWIELLKNAYYTRESGYVDLETLPNIDVNIKTGNSLLHRYQLDDSISGILRNHRISVSDYKAKVSEYKNTKSKSIKRELTQVISQIQSKLHECISLKDPQYLDLLKEQKQLDKYESQTLFGSQLSGFDVVQRDKLRVSVAKKQAAWIERREFATKKKAFEWRVEFPELLDAEGNFIGFDILGGNPPYGQLVEDDLKERFKAEYRDVHFRTIDVYNYFISMGFRLLRPNGILSYIIPNTLLSQNDFEKARVFLMETQSLESCENMGENVFKDADVPTCIIRVRKRLPDGDYSFKYTDFKETDNDSIVWGRDQRDIAVSDVSETPGHIIGLTDRMMEVLGKVQPRSVRIDDIAEEVASGISTGANDAFIYTPEQIRDNNLEPTILKPVLRGEDIDCYSIGWKGDMIAYTRKNTDIEMYPKIKTMIARYQADLEKRRETKKGLIPWWGLNWPRKQEVFEGEKIILRQTADSIRATYDAGGFYNINSILDLTLRQGCGFSYLFVLGVLNSSLSQEIYKGISQEDGRAFAEVKPINIRKMFIPQASEEFKQAVESIVDDIMSGSVSEEDGQSTIDAMLYEFYNLEPRH